MNLNFQGMQILMEELQQQEMWAIYLMGHGKEMTDVVSKLNITRIICVLCQKLNWIEEDMESDDCPNKADEKIVETPSDITPIRIDCCITPAITLLLYHLESLGIFWNLLE